MSRFYEMLNEVSRSPQVPNGGSSQQQVGATGTSGLEQFPIPAVSDTEQLPGVERSAEFEPAVGRSGIEFADIAPPHVDPPHAEMSNLELPDLEARNIELPGVEPPHVQSQDDLFNAFAPRQNDFAGKPVKVTLDSKEALIPYTADPTVVERYRRLRTKIQQQHATKPIQSLLVASPGPGEGKTITAINLALSFALLPSFKVLLIDGDLRKGTLGKWLGTNNLAGLSNLIEGSARLDEIIFKSDEVPFHFMLRGTSSKPATELLNSPTLQDVIRRMTQHFDLVLLDSPPVNLIADAHMLAASCDGVLMVARAFWTTNKAFEKALDDFSAFRIVGTVLNCAMREERSRKHYQY